MLRIKNLTKIVASKSGTSVEKLMELMDKILIHSRILILGCGAVAQCVLPLLFKHFEFDPKKMTIVSAVNTRDRVGDILAKGASLIVETITKENMDHILSQYAGPGDLTIDLACNIDCGSIIQWCNEHDVLYINTSIEVWNPFEKKGKSSPADYTLYVRHMALREQIKKWNNSIGATAVLDHGANPGLVSHFTKKALIDIAQRLIEEKPTFASEIENYIRSNQFGKLAQALGVKTIHISERDTQISSKPKQVNEFVNTWSIDGFLEEGIAPAEMGWGTHERKLPNGAVTHTQGPLNQICLAKPGIQTWVRSWVPSGPIIGMVVRHGEAFTISDYLTVWDKGCAIYRPTVHYAYCPSDEAMNSLHEMIMNNYNIQPKQRIMNDEIISGTDEVGVLIMGHAFTAWWAGSILEIDESRRLVPKQSATTLQVAASIIAAITWMLKNPRRGVCVPDDLPYQEILDVASPYLGTMISQAVDWTPLKDRATLYEGYTTPTPSEEDVWQFETFLV